MQTRRTLMVGAAALPMLALAQTAPPPRIRRNITDPLAARDLAQYRRAVALMRARTNPADVYSWAFIANGHGYRQSIPSTMTGYWNKCEHFTAHFLSYHRKFCIVFEQKARTLLGDPSFALPYWDVYQHPTMPAPFLGERLANGAANPLFYPGRKPWVPPVALTTDWLRESTFEGMQAAVERSPHAYYHRSINGILGDPLLAANDPLFPTLHCGVDRLWNKWRWDTAFNRGHTDPIDPNWLDRRHLFDVSRSLTNRQVLSTKANGYVYDNWRMPVVL